MSVACLLRYPDVLGGRAVRFSERLGCWLLRDRCLKPVSGDAICSHRTVVLFYAAEHLFSRLSTRWPRTVIKVRYE
jgi:hypothetical protein